MECHRMLSVSIACFLIIFSVCECQFIDNQSVNNLLFQSENSNSLFGSFVNTFSENCHAPSSSSSYIQPKYLKMYQYHQGTFYSYPLLEAADLLLKSETFNPEYTTVIYVNGFRCPPNDKVATSLAEAFEKKGGVNFLSYDFYRYGNGDYFQYFEVVRNTSPLANYLANFILNLTRQGVRRNKIRLIGFSYGGQLAGVSAYYYRKSSGSPLARVTALDPTALCFPDSTNIRLGKHNAKYVETIQTSILSASRSGMGHANFIVNGNVERQPGCGNDFILCVHQRSVQLYKESITDEQSLLAVNCDSWYNFSNGRCRNNKISPLGFSSRTDNRGNFYIRTALKPPFGIGAAGTI